MISFVITLKGQRKIIKVTNCHYNQYIADDDYESSSNFGMDTRRKCIAQTMIIYFVK